MYYVISGRADNDGNMMGFTFKKDHRARVFHEGQRFSVDASKAWLKPPKEPLRIEIKEGRENDPFPTFLEEPVPIMSKKLLAVLKATGVDNIDSYEAELYYADGRLASTDYVVFNLIGVVSAVDMENSEYDTDQQDRVISMSFDSLTIDETKTFGFLMFRLARY